MNQIKLLIKKNMFYIIFYVILTLLFYTLNFLFFRNNIDAPVDLIFALIFNIFVPGIFFFVLLYKNIEPYYSKESIITTWSSILILSISIPLLFSFIYILLNQQYQYIHYLLLHYISLPIIFLATITTFEIKNQFENLIAKIIFILLYIISYYFLNLILRYNTSSLNLYINVIYLFIIPFIIILLGFKRLLKYH